MIDPLTAGAAGLFGAKILEILTAGAEDHAKDLVKKLFEKGEAIPFQESEREALEEAYRSALTHATQRMVDALGRVLSLTESKERIELRAASVEVFFQSPRVA